jgi:indole-3-glycerol phosphate synthase
MLDEILTATEPRARDAAIREAEFRATAAAIGPTRDFTAALRAPGLSVIAEVKRRSPSAGTLAEDLEPAEQARRYAAGGAAAVSVLTEPHYFDGSLGDLIAARRATDLPVLRKDFVLHGAQIWEARAAGADAVLLIAAALDDELLSGFLEVAAAASLAALVEVHNEVEAERALEAGASMVGVNNRDLHSFVTDLGVAERLALLLEGVEVRVAESGVTTPEDAGRMEAAGYDAVLVGSALVQSPDPASLIRSLQSR